MAGKSKRMRLPNGFGGITQMKSGNRRNPYRARKTVGKDELGKPILKTIGYYKTYNDAYSALMAYNENPYDLVDADHLTFAEVYEKWSNEHFENIVPSAIRTWKSAYRYCEPIYKIRMMDLRVNHLEQTIKDASVGDNTKARMKSLFNLMYRYALKHEIVNKNYAELCNSVRTPNRKIDRVPYSNDEIQLLFQNTSFPFVDMILIAIYSGWRPQELATLKTADVDLEEMTFKGGLKTDFSKNRIVPIHPKIQQLVLNRYDESKEYLFNDENGQQGTYMTYDKYRGRFTKVNKKFNLNHKPHDTRHTFITMAKAVGIDEYILKLIVGHAIEDITEKVYTHRTLEQLKNEINKI